jgi:hypothetical protein
MNFTGLTQLPLAQAVWRDGDGPVQAAQCTWLQVVSAGNKNPVDGKDTHEPTFNPDPSIEPGQRASENYFWLFHFPRVFLVAMWRLRRSSGC